MHCTAIRTCPRGSDRLSDLDLVFYMHRPACACIQTLAPYSMHAYVFMLYFKHSALPALVLAYLQAHV